MIGRIKWFDSKKGFGFITDCETKEEVFVHHTNITVKEQCWKSLSPGEYVNFERTEADGKVQATEVTGVMGGPLMCETRHLLSQERQNYKSNKVVEGDLEVNGDIVLK